jgi:UDP-glucose 4-epimerase
MTCVVTGATGLIGRAVIAELLSRGESVLALSRSAAEYYRQRPHSRLRACKFDLALDSPDKLDGYLESADRAVRLVMLSSLISMSTAPQDLAPVLAVDAYGHLGLLEWLGRRLSYVVYASSCTVYGQPTVTPVPETAPLSPQNVYALTKVAAERALGALAEQVGVPFGILRLAQVYGPGAPLIGAMYGFLKAAAGGEVPRVTCDPDAFRDYCHVDDVTTAIWLALQRNAAGVYNVGSGAATTIVELARACLRVAGRGAEPDLAGGGAAGNMLLDIAKAGRELGYAPRVLLAEGLRREYQRLFAGGALSTEARLS